MLRNKYWRIFATFVEKLYVIMLFITSCLQTFGEYALFMRKVLTKPDKWKESLKRYVVEISKLGIDSIPLVIVISLFIGAVCAIQMQINFANPLLPSYTVGLATRDILLLEFSSSILCLILAGKVGSNIASEIGTMRVTEQIDALEIMGINSCNFLVLPKIMALLTFIPVLTIFSMCAGLIGGYFVALMGIIPVSQYIYGIQSYFVEWYVWYAIIKSLFFSVVITSVASFYGYYVKGGALEVGKASTNSVVASSVLILLLDVLLTNLLLQ